MLKEIGTRRPHPRVHRAREGQDASFRLMGFGHRVYKNYDPRAAGACRRRCHEVLSELGNKDDPLLDIAMELEKIALNDDYFVERKLYPERRLLFGHHPARPWASRPAMFTVLFALARTVGWIAQWNEMIEDPSRRSAGRASSTPVRTHREFVPQNERG